MPLRTFFLVTIFIGVLLGCGPGVIEGSEEKADLCALSNSQVGRECDTVGTPCACNNVCGADPFAQGNTFITNYCFKRCDADLGCDNKDDICVSLAPDRGLACVASGTMANQEWEAIILPGGLFLRKISLEATFDGVSRTFSYAAAALPDGMDNPQEDKVVLTFSSAEKGDEFWYIQVHFPLIAWEENADLQATPTEDEADNSFTAKLFREQGNQVWLEAIAIEGSLHIDDVQNIQIPAGPGLGISGSLELSFAGFRGEIDVTKFPPRFPGTPIPVQLPVFTVPLIEDHMPSEFRKEQ